MPDTKQRVKEAREDLRELRRGGLTEDIKVTTVEQQLNKLEKAVNKYGNNSDNSGIVSNRITTRLERRITQVEQRINKLRDKIE